MPKYVVTTPWHGVKKGEILELNLKEINPAFRTNLTAVDDPSLTASQAVGDSVVVLPLDDLDSSDGRPPFDWEAVRADVIAELDDADMTYDSEAPAAELAAMLPHEVAEAIKLGAE